jgi:crotonobetainyl-CoA:carnitine CoA-transferase CaiB-like acyl-CoA transferase
MSGALAGLRILELGDFAAAPICARILADLGAEVIKVEPPHGDSARLYGPFAGDVPDPERSGLFLYLNHNKRGITLDCGSPGGRASLDLLLADTDILLIGSGPGGRLAVELDLAEIHERFPALIVVGITPFGLSGKYAGLAGADINVAAMSGLTSDPDSLSEAEGRVPLMPPALQIDLLSGLGAVVTTMAAVLQRGLTGRGQIVDFAQTQMLATHSAQGLPTHPAQPKALRPDEPLPPAAPRRKPRSQYPSHVVQCQDGPVFLYAPQIQQWLRLVEAMGEPDWTKEPRFRNRLAMANEYRAETDAHVESWLRQHTKQELLQVFMDHRVPSGPILNARDMVESDHLAAREFFQRTEHPVAGAVTIPGFQFRMGETPMQMRRPAPTLGEHNGEVLAGLEARGDAPAACAPRTPRSEAAPRDVRPLAGVRVVDFGTVMVGGISSRMVAELGAEVIKVESRVSPDGYRIGRPTIGDEQLRADESQWPELQAGFHSLNRDKLAITLNLNKPEGVDLLKRLIAVSDVVMNNYSPGVLERRGLDYQSLTGLNPDLIEVAMPGAGETGPLRNYATYAWTVEALVGMTSINGYQDGLLLGNLAMPWGDIINGLSGALAVLVAVHHRRQTGAGQYVESAQLEAFAALMGVPYLDYALNGRVAVPQGNAHPLMAPHSTYPVAGRRWIAIAVRTPEQWRALCEVMGHPEWIEDPRFAELPARQRHLAELDALITGWTQGRTAEEAVDALQARGVAATPVLHLDDQVRDDYFFDREAFIPLTHPLIGSMLVPGRAATLEGGYTPPRAAPTLGEHNDYVFGELLGLSAEARERLVRDEVLF